MGVYKTLHYRLTTQRWRPCKGEALFYGLGPNGAPLPPLEDLADMREAAREARAEREAIRAVEREAEEERRKAEEAARPKVFAPPPPDFARSDRPTPAPEPDHAGLACPLSQAKAVARDRAELADVAAGRIAPALAALREDLGPPEPPAVPTGWYRCGDGYYRVGSGPYPEYRPPGLRWRLHWTHPKPDDVAWEDEPARWPFLDQESCIKIDEYRSAQLVKARRVREPTGTREPAGKADQLRFAW